MVPNDSPYPKTWGLKKIRSLACIEAELLPEVLLDLLQPIPPYHHTILYSPHTTIPPYYII